MALLMLQQLAPLGLGKAGAGLSLPMQIAVSLTLLTLLPAAVMCITPFLRITIVLHFLRQALGTQTTPSNQVLIGLAMFLTIVITQPIAQDIYDNAWTPLERGEITTQAGDRSRLSAAKDISGEICSGEGRPAVRRDYEVSRAANAGRSRPPCPDPRLHSFRAEDRISDRRRSVPSVSDHRSGGRFGHTHHRHGPATSGHDFGAVQDPAVRAGRRLESCGRIAAEELLLR